MSAAPRFPISALRSVDLQVPDLDRACDFYTNVWGLEVGDREGDRVLLRGRGNDAYLLALRKGDSPAVEGVTFRIDAMTNLDQLRSRVAAAGASALQPIDGSGSGLGDGFSFRDPRGRRFSLVQGDQPAPPHPGLEHAPTRLAHININTSAIEADIAFLRDGMGFQVTDRTKQMAFLRTNADHHAIVLAEDSVDTLNHVAFLHDDLESVMKAGGRIRDAGYPIGWGPGRHGPGDNVFLYFVDPFGIVIEHTAEVLEVDDGYRVGTPEDWIWPPGRTDQWGICSPKTTECKNAQRLIPFL
ncbi:VOC family protein [Devosia sp. LjRoot3]|uniref:VOC family protein n=1 Tax=Devosia sp. LjRoot3 TaxID=3342319 RepID=UPI003ECDEAAD